MPLDLKALRRKMTEHGMSGHPPIPLGTEGEFFNEMLAGVTLDGPVSALDVARLVSEVESLRALLRRLTVAAQAVSDEHGPVEDEGCDHCALMWRELNDALASAIREEP